MFLCAVAVITGIRKVLHYGTTAILFGDDVIRLMRRARVFLMYSTILATTVRSIAYFRAKSGRNPLGAHQAARKCKRACALS